MTAEATALFPDEVVTRAHVRYVDLPQRTGTAALITLDNGHDHTKPNTIGPAGLASLGAALDEVEARDDLVAVCLTGKPFILAAGADTKGMARLARREHARDMVAEGNRVFRRLGEGRVPSFAFVNGLALGGGLEVALHCTYRTVSRAAPAIGLPECFVGLVPSWGGAWLLPHIVGPDAAVTVIIENALNNGRTLTGEQAHRLGLADAAFDAADFLEQSLAWAAGVVSGRVRVERSGVDHSPEAWDAAVARGRAIADAKTSGTAPAPYAALDLIAKARTQSKDEALAEQAEMMADLLMGDESRASLYAFDLVQRRAKRPAGAPDPELARTVAKVGVVGAGLMASQLALLLARRLEVPVVMTDLDQERVDRGVDSVRGEVGTLLARKRISPDQANRLRALVSGSTDTAVFADADLVIEAVFEEMKVKRQVFAELEAVVSETCVLATNTSSLSVSEIAADLRHPQRVLGLHFFNPVALMPLLEVVRAERTDDPTLATGFAVGKRLKKTTVLVQDSPAFIVNRLLGRWLGEVSRAVDQGTPVEVADAAFAGLAPLPPFVLLGLVGPAVALHTAETLAEAFPSRFQVSDNLRRVVEAGKPGIYTWVDGRPLVDPEMADLFRSPDRPVVLTREQVRDQVLAALAEEARLMLDEGVVGEPQDLDLAMITGAGFSFWNGGLTPLLDRLGISERVTGRRFLRPGVASVPR